MSAAAVEDATRAGTGIAGLDDVLGGGFPRNRLYLVQGEPGSGKTTLGMQFLLEGVRRKETAVYVTLSETEEELRTISDSHGWSLEGITLHQVANDESSLADENTLFHPSEVELGETTQQILAEVRRVSPTRVVFDSLSEIRLLAQDPLRLRRVVLALKRHFEGRRCTVLMLEDIGSEGSSDLRTVAHGVVMLEQLAPAYGADRRRVRVLKMRGVKFSGGFHDMRIHKGGIVVYPRLIASEHHAVFPKEPLPSGIAALDSILGGGIERGTSTLFLGPAGSGKSAIATQYVVSAAREGEKCAYYTFDEGLGTLFVRSASLGLDLQPFVDAGTLYVTHVDPAELSPGEFAHHLLDRVEKGGVRIVVIDSLNGYLTAMPDERFLNAHLHELFSALRQRGVVIISTIAQHGFLGSMATPVDVSYLADTVLMFRYYEAEGELRKAISSVKKRSGPHESTIRGYSFAGGRIAIGEPLRDLRGITTGVPVVLGERPSGG
jgi:circadian clock protein KaiC